MKTVVKSAAVAFGFAFIQACGGAGTMPAPQPTPGDQSHRGLAEQPEDQIAGAVESLAPEEESAGSFATMVDMLRGRVAGLQVLEEPGGVISIRIRGDLPSSFNPLLVVDGVPVPAYAFTSTLRTMDPRNVRNIQVLKDAGSTSSYGNRGAHGVILITLRRR